MSLTNRPLSAVVSSSPVVAVARPLVGAVLLCAALALPACQNNKSSAAASSSASAPATSGQTAAAKPATNTAKPAGSAMNSAEYDVDETGIPHKRK
jgi:hypothetical protein